MLELIKQVESKNNARQGLYKCTCGSETIKPMALVKNGRYTKCRLCALAAKSAKQTTHGDSNSKLYRVWSNMRGRCNNPTDSSYKHYGALGITVDKEWDNYTAFKEWAVNAGYREGLSLDKDRKCIELGIDPKRYGPSTCEWTTVTTQNQATKVLRSTNTSKYRGSSLTKEGFYRASITVSGNRIKLGTYRTALEASYVYDLYITRHSLQHTRNNIQLNYLPATIGEQNESRTYKRKGRTTEENLSQPPYT